MDLNKLRTDILEHESARRVNRDCLKHSLEIGRMLIQAKKSIPRGKYEKWVKEATGYSKTQCYRFIQLANVPYTEHLTEADLLNHFRELNNPPPKIEVKVLGDDVEGPPPACPLPAPNEVAADFIRKIEYCAVLLKEVKSKEIAAMLMTDDFKRTRKAFSLMAREMVQINKMGGIK